MRQQSQHTPMSMGEQIARSSEAELGELRARITQLEQNAVNEKWLHDAIKGLIFGTASATGHEFLQLLTQQVAAILKVPYVFITEWIPGRTYRLRTVAGWCNDRAADPIAYDVADAPCQKVLQDGEAFFPRHVQQLFPHDRYLTEFNIESYMGVSLRNRDGQPTGHLCIMDVQPFMFDDTQGSTIIRAFAERAAAELDRFRAEKTLKQNEQAIRSFLQVTSEPGLTVDQRLQEVLELGCRRFSLPIGTITQVRGDEMTLTHVLDPESKLTSGMRLSLCKTYCANTFQRDEPLYFENAGASEWRTHPGYKSVGFECYIGTKLMGQSLTHGTMCFMGREPYRGKFTKADKEFLQLMGRWVGAELDRKDSEQALRASESRLHRFVSNAPIGLVILDEEKRLMSANKAFCELTGYEEHEVLGQTYELYTHPEDLPANLILTDEFYRGIRREYTYEKRYIKKSGEIIWVSVTATHVELPGHTGPLLLATIQDITEQRLATAERQQLSHDLHDNILQSLYAVGMNIEVSKMVMNQSPSRSKIHLTQAIDQLNHLLGEIRRFITVLTEPRVHEPNFEQALLQLVASVSCTSQGAPRFQIEESAMKLITPVQGEHLVNIAREALSNSMRHARAKNRSLRLSHTPTGIRLLIRDDGIGFDTKRHRNSRGHGLGNMAARTKTILARLTIRSAPGKGTTVSVIVPMKKKSSTPNLL